MRTLSCILALLFAANSLTAAELGFHFQGQVTSKYADPYGKPVSASSLVDGRFIFDSESTVTHILSSCDCAGYRQQITGGFFADFGDTHVRSDDYVIEVANNLVQPSGFVTDGISIRFGDDYSPALTSPINVADTEFSTGTFNLNFLGPGSLYSSTALPSTIDMANFLSEFNMLSQMTLGIPDVLFEVTSLSSFPVIKGDYNFDGTVTTADDDLWRDSYGFTSDLSADGNRNGIVDAADFTTTRDRRTGASSVPESIPGAGWQFLAFLCLYRFQHRPIAGAKACHHRQ